jgi:carboxymethylenebutenolidase
LADFDADARVVLAALRDHAACNGRFGVVGLCLGGHLAYRAALNPEVQAAACFYPTDIHSGTLGTGGQADSLARAGDIKGELMLVWGRQDPHIPYEGRLRIYQALHENGVRFTWHEFNCEHAFLRDEGARYNAWAARQALGLAFDLFHRVLSTACP